MGVVKMGSHMPIFIVQWHTKLFPPMIYAPYNKIKGYDLTKIPYFEECEKKLTQIYQKDDNPSNPRGVTHLDVLDFGVLILWIPYCFASQRIYFHLAAKIQGISCLIPLQQPWWLKFWNLERRLQGDSFPKPSCLVSTSISHFLDCKGYLDIPLTSCPSLKPVLTDLCITLWLKLLYHLNVLIS